MRGRAMNAMPAEAGRGSANTGNADDGEERPAPEQGHKRQVFLS